MTERTFAVPPTAQEAVLTELRRALVEGDLVPGQRINVNQMAKDLGVSRAPLRDALRVLEGEEQVRYLAHRGYTVTPLSLPDLFDIYRMRELLEAEAERLALSRLTEARVMSIQRAAEKVSVDVAQHNPVQATVANRDFHFTLFAASDHPRLVKSIRHLWDSDFARALYFVDDARAATSDAEHYPILEAIRAADLDRLIELLDNHRDNELCGVLEYLEKTGDEEARLALVAVKAGRPPWKPTNRP